MASTVEYEGIGSQMGLDMCVSGSQLLRPQILMSIRITDSEPIAVRVNVDANQKTWHLPKKLLTTHSTFFAAALDGGFAEQDSKMVNLPEVLSKEFQIWIKWLYLGKLHLGELHPKGDEEPRIRKYKELVRLWNLGDMLECPMFQDVTLTELLYQMSEDDTVDCGMPPELPAFIWDACAPGSKLRKLAIDQCIIDIRMGRLERGSEKAYIQFAEDNEDFASAYVAASIRNGPREREHLWEDRQDYFSSPQSNK